jgi:hypothetical protein
LLTPTGTGRTTDAVPEADAADSSRNVAPVSAAYRPAHRTAAKAPSEPSTPTTTGRPVLALLISCSSQRAEPSLTRMVTTDGSIRATTAGNAAVDAAVELLGAAPGSS